MRRKLPGDGRLVVEPLWPPPNMAVALAAMSSRVRFRPTLPVSVSPVQVPLALPVLSAASMTHRLPSCSVAAALALRVCAVPACTRTRPGVMLRIGTPPFGDLFQPA